MPYILLQLCNKCSVNSNAYDDISSTGLFDLREKYNPEKWPFDKWTVKPYDISMTCTNIII